MSSGLTEGKFLGATISSFSTNGAWNEQTSTINITIVEDILAGDDCLLSDANTDNLGGKMMGSPQQFTYNGFSLVGILESYDQSVSTEGNPIYQVVLTYQTMACCNYAAVRP